MRSPRLRATQLAASETVGTVLLLVIAVALAGVFALTIFTLPPPLPSSHATLQAMAPPASGEIVLEHRGGPPIPLNALSATVTINGTAQSFNIAQSLGAGWTVVSASGQTKGATDSFAAGDQAIYAAPALWGANASIAVVNGATTGVAGAALALEPVVVQTADSVAPTLVSAQTTSATSLLVNFTEPLRNASAPDTPDTLSPLDFTVQTGGATYSIASIHLLSNGSAASFALATPMPAGATPFVNSTHSPVYVSDLAGNRFAPDASVVAADGVAPAITGVAAGSVTTSGATISWTTDEPSATNLVYAGPTPGLGFTPVTAIGSGTSHSATLAGLSDNQQYFVQVLSADASGNTALSSVVSFTTSQLPASSGGNGTASNRLALSSSLSLRSGSLSPALAVTLQNGNGTPTSASSDLTVRLATNSSSGSFQSAGGAPISNVTILAGTSSGTFYYIDYRDAGSSILTAQADGVISASSVANVTQVSGRTFPYHLAFTATPAMPMANGADVSGFAVSLLDSFDRPIVPPWALTVNLSTNSTVGYFVDSASSATITSVTLNGASSASFKYHDARGGNSLILAYANGTQPASSAVTIAGTSSILGFLNQAATWTAAQTFGSGDLNVSNIATSTGTLLLPLGSDTIPGIGQGQIWTGIQTFGAGKLNVTNLATPTGTLAFPSGSGQLVLSGQIANADVAANAAIAYSKLNLAGSLAASDFSPSDVTTAAIAPASVTYEKLNLNASSIPWSAVSKSGAQASDIGALANATNSIPTADIQNGAITNAKLAAGAVDLAGADVTGILANGNIASALSGKTYNGLTINTGGSASLTLANTHAYNLGANDLAFTTTGPTSLTLPTSGTLLSTSSVIGVANGGTGLTSLTAHDLLIGNGASTPTLLAPSATPGLALVSQGSTADPAYGALDLATSGAVTGALPAANGGTGITTYTLGDTLYASGPTTLAKLPGNTQATKTFLSQTGTGTVSAAPSWSALSASDIPNLDASKITSGTLADARLSTNVALLNVANNWSQVQTFSAGIRLLPTTNTSIPACTPALEGSLWWDGTNHTLRMCGSTGQSTLPSTIPSTSGANTWTGQQTFNAGTFVMQNKFINVQPAVSSTQTTMAFNAAEPDANYGVSCQSGGNWNGNANLIVLSKTTTNFVVTYNKITSIGSPNPQTIDCFIFR